MTKPDARSLTKEAQAVLRRQACVLRDRKGLQSREIAELLNVHPATVRRWWADFDRRGEAAFEVGSDSPGRPRRLSDDDIAWLKPIVIDSTPREHGFESPLWTLEIMTALLKRERGVTISVSAIHVTVTRAGLRARKPRRQATERNDEEVERFMREVWPEVEEAVLTEGARVAFLDEAQVRADAPLGTTWSERGKRPVVKATGTRPWINIISAITWDGDLWFEAYDGSLDGARFTGFLQKLAEEVRPVGAGRLFVVLDGLRVHFCEPVKQFLATEAGKHVRLVQLPAYAPDLNADEHVWSWLKGYAIARHPIERREKVRDVVEAELGGLAEDRDKVRSMFKHPAVSYVARAAGFPPGVAA